VLAGNGLVLDASQEEAFAKVRYWLEHDRRTVFKLFGGAGTGKTSMARIFVEGLDARFAAYTGKAAYRLRQVGCTQATTLHRLLYTPMGKDKNGALQFKYDPAAALRKLDVLVVDEASMLGPKIAADIVKSCKKVLVLGDPFQLPPVDGASTWMRDPDHTLEYVHRQADGSPILDQATELRQTGKIRIRNATTAGGRVGLVPNGKELSCMQYCEQLLVGTNATRKYYNDQARRLRGFRVPHIVDGDRVVCTKNNHKMGVFNGSLWDVEDASSVKRNGYQSVILRSCDDPEHVVESMTHSRVFMETGEKVAELNDKFLYLIPGYALTVHKAQGSQWDKVMVLDQSHVFRDDSARWLYTAMTRAARELWVAPM